MVGKSFDSFKTKLEIGSCRGPESVVVAGRVIGGVVYRRFSDWYLWVFLENDSSPNWS